MSSESMTMPAVPARGKGGSEAEDRSDRYCIVGAGPSGLATARALARSGIGFDVLERGRGVGGIWNAESGDSPMYESAHFISSKTLSGFSEYPMPASYPDYPSWRLVRDYLRAFARDHDLERRVELGVGVERVEPVESVERGWRVTVAGGAVRTYRGVVLCTGHQWIPREPSYPGTFTGTAHHAFYYRSPEELRGKRVLVVGGGNSGCDIAADAAAHAERAWISLRRGYHFLPKHLFGKPLDVFFRSGPELPAWLAQPVLSALLRIVVGDLARYGLPKPDHRVLASHPIVNSQLLHHLAHGDIAVKPDVRALEGRTVRFADGSAEDVDLIIWATGYQARIPCLDDTVLPPDEPTRELFVNVVHRRHAELYVVGLFETDGGAYPVISKQAELVAAAIQARRAGGDIREWLEERVRTANPDLSGGVRHIATPRHAIYVQYEAYGRYVERLLRKLPRRGVGALSANRG